MDIDEKREIQEAWNDYNSHMEQAREEIARFKMLTNKMPPGEIRAILDEKLPQPEGTLTELLVKMSASEAGENARIEWREYGQ